MLNFPGEYKATVVSIDDPDNADRVKVRVKGLMDGIPDEYLPWARQRSVTATKKGGSTYLPTVGSKVSVRFGGGDLNDAYYYGGVVEERNDLPKNASKDRYIIYESPDKRITLTVNDSLGDIEIKTSKYNTTLNTVLEAVLEHVHMYSLSGVPTQTSTAALGTSPPVPPKSPVTSANFNTGTLK